MHLNNRRLRSEFRPARYVDGAFIKRIGLCVAARMLQDAGAAGIGKRQRTWIVAEGRELLNALGEALSNLQIRADQAVDFRLQQSQSLPGRRDVLLTQKSIGVGGVD